VLLHKLLGEADILIRDGRRFDRSRLFMAPRFLEVLAFERAANRNLALRAAADRADVAANAGTEAPRAAGFANRAVHSLSIGVR
jgi:hypothetical protein